MRCQFNYFVNYCWKSIVKSIIFSIITWSGLVKPGFESSLDPSLDSEGEGLSRVWTKAYNWPIQGSVSDPCPCLVQTEPWLKRIKKMWTCVEHKVKVIWEFYRSLSNNCLLQCTIKLALKRQTPLSWPQLLQIFLTVISDG